ncbi:MAG TPA: BatD family protein [Thermoanaerobaculia bacterium]
MGEGSQNAERRTQNVEIGRHARILFFVLRSAFCVLTSSAFANDLHIDKRTLSLTDTLIITVSLEEDFANVETVDVPVRNLRILGEPSTSTEFAWVNGQTTRRKVLRFRARGLEPGAATVGPLVLRASNGQVDTLNAQALQVMADRTSSSNDPEVILRELQGSGRDLFFMVAEVDKTRVVAGEQVVVTWTLYNAAVVQQWQISGVPKLEDFWSEEIDVRSVQPEQTFVGDVVMQRVPVRRVALFPLRSGPLRISGMSVEAAIMRRMRGGPFSVFEGSLVDVTYTAAPLTIAVEPLPMGPKPDAVGEFVLQCGKPWQANNGPVVIDVTLSGSGNARASAAPRFAGRVAGNVQIEAGEVTVRRDLDAVAMTRKWKYVLFPAEAGTMTIPPLVLDVFSPATRQRRQLRCEAALLVAQTAGLPASASRPAAVKRSAAMRRWVPRIAAALLLAAFAALAWPRYARYRKLRAEARRLAAGSATEIRERVDERLRSRGVDLARLARDPGERGDAYRALVSLLDALERNRHIDAGETEITRRIRDLLTIAP